MIQLRLPLAVLVLCFLSPGLGALPRAVDLASGQDSSTLPDLPVQHAVLGNAEKPLGLADLDALDAELLPSFLDEQLWVDGATEPAAEGQLSAIRLLVRNTLDQVLPSRVMVPGIWNQEMRLYAFTTDNGQVTGQVTVVRSGSSFPLGVPAGCTMLLYFVHSVPGIQLPILLETGDSTLAGFEARSWLTASLVCASFCLAGVLALLAVLLAFPAWGFAAAGLAWAALWTWLGYWSGSDAAGTVIPGFMRDFRALLLAAPGTGLFCAFIAAILGRIHIQRFRYWAGFSATCFLLGGILVLSGREDLAWSFMKGVELFLLVPLGAALVFRYGTVPLVKVRQISMVILFRLQGFLLFLVVLVWLIWPGTQLWLPVAGGLPGPVLWLFVWFFACSWILVQEMLSSRRREKRIVELEQWRDESETVIKSSIQTIESQKAEIRRLGESDDESGFLKKEHFMQSLERELVRYLRHGGIFSLVVVELDNTRKFKDSNPETVRWIRNWFFGCMKGNMRKSDLVGRYGDFSLIFIMPETTALQSMFAAEKFRALIQQRSFSAPDLPVECAGGLTASIGVASPRKSGQDIHRLLQEVDDALTRAHAAGGNRAALSSHSLNDPGT